MHIVTDTRSNVKQISDDFARCPGCYNWHQRTSLVKYPSGTIADWRDYYLCQRCDYTLEYSAYDAAYNHILTNISVYDGGAE